MKNLEFRISNLEFLVGMVVALSVIVAAIAIITLDTTGKKGSGLSKDFIYDLNDIAKIDPNLILYEESGEPIRTGFTDSHAIVVVSDGTMYVAGDKAIRIFGHRESGIVNRITSHEPRFPDRMRAEIKLAEAPGCLAVVTDGKIYVGMKDHVEVYSQQGERLSAWKGLGGDAILTSIAVSKNDVFVADAGNRIVIHYDTAGNVINHIGKKDTNKNIPGFMIPSPYFDLAVGRDGLLRVVNPGLHRIEAYTFDGDLEFWWGRFSSSIEGFCGCCNPVNFAIHEDDSFVTCEKGLVRVKIYDPEGVFVCVVAGPDQLVEGGTSGVSEFGAGAGAGAFDVAVDAKGRVFVLDTIKNIVRIFTRVEKRQ